MSEGQIGVLNNNQKIMIQIKNLNKKFSSSSGDVEIFKNLNLEIKDGEFIALI
jgi:ABC-type sugar transport system ATPase subunit